MIEEDIKIIRQVLTSVWTMEHHKEIDSAIAALRRIESKLNTKTHDVDEFYKE